MKNLTLPPMGNESAGLPSPSMSTNSPCIVCSMIYREFECFCISDSIGDIFHPPCDRYIYPTQSSSWLDKEST